MFYCSILNCRRPEQGKKLDPDEMFGHSENWSERGRCIYLSVNIETSKKWSSSWVRYRWKISQLRDFLNYEFKLYIGYKIRYLPRWFIKQKLTFNNVNCGISWKISTICVEWHFTTLWNTQNQRSKTNKQLEKYDSLSVREVTQENTSTWNQKKG